MGKAVPHMLPYTLSVSQTSTTMRNRANMFPFLIISGLCSLVSGLPPHYHFVNDRKNWTDAQKYCREMYSDLATIYDKVDIDHLTETVQIGKAWIGLERGDLLKWHWSLANRDFYKDGDLIFRNWKNGEPSTDGGKESCAVMHPSGKWSDEDCNSKRPFICLKGKNSSEKGFILITENKAWREAQTFCRETHTDLVSVRNGSENQEIQKMVQSQNVWIGLFTDPWKWSDHSNSSFRFWMSKQPNNLQGEQNCVAILLDSFGRWNDFRCKRKRPFFCQGEKKSKSPLPTSASVKHTQKTTEENSEQEAIKNTGNVTTKQSPKKHTSTSIIMIKQTAKATTTTQQSTHHTTSEHQAPTSYSTSKQGATEPTITMNSFQHKSTAQTNSVHITAEHLTTQLPFPNHKSTTKLPTTEHASSEQPMAKYIITTEHTDQQILTTQYKNATSEEAITKHSNQDYLILIRENKTWSEALRYCREHHINLVSVTTAATQSWVAKTAEGASTTHVWLGLRFTCTFRFWFWITYEQGCYQNWAQGHGPAGSEECGHTGAMQSGGDHRWVSLPETDKLNFICYTCDGK